MCESAWLCLSFEAQLAERAAFRQCVLLAVLLVERLIVAELTHEPLFTFVYGKNVGCQRAFLTKLAFTFPTLVRE